MTKYDSNCWDFIGGYVTEFKYIATINEHKVISEYKLADYNDTYFNSNEYYSNYFDNPNQTGILN